VSSVDTTPEGLGSYQLSVDRAGLADGTYNATIAASSDAGDLDISVRMQVATVNVAADAGLHYVILVAADNSVIGPDIVSASNGVYEYTFTAVPFGQYEIIAGTDQDDDFFICDTGEACGTYPTLDAPVVVSVNSDMANLNFVSSFRLDLTEVNALARTDSDPKLPPPAPERESEDSVKIEKISRQVISR
jgi:serine protease